MAADSTRGDVGDRPDHVIKLGNTQQAARLMQQAGLGLTDWLDGPGQSAIVPVRAS